MCLIWAFVGRSSDQSVECLLIDDLLAVVMGLDMFFRIASKLNAAANRDAQKKDL